MSQVIVLGYLRVSTQEQVEHGSGLDAQRDTLRLAAARHGWQLQLVADEGKSAANLDRPALLRALERLERGEAQALAVAKLDRLSRSLFDFADLMLRAKEQGWALIALDLGVDTSTSTGRLVANLMASVADWERERIAERTKEGLRQRRLQGIRLGRPLSIPDEVREEIIRRHRRGHSYRSIAQHLNDAGVPTARGGAVWYPATVRAAVVAVR